MMFTSLRPQAAPARLIVARSSQRVFSDAEWDAATKAASKLLEASEVAVEQGSSETAVADATPPPAGRTFSDAQWDQALKEAISKCVIAREPIHAFLRKDQHRIVTV